MQEDELKQKEIIKLRELKREVKEISGDLERFNKVKEKIREELKELLFYQDKNKKQYRKELLARQELEKKIDKIQSNVLKLEAQRKGIIKQLDSEIMKKTKDLNNFKDGKKNFVKSLENQEKEFQQKDREVKQKLVEISDEQERLKEKEKLLGIGLILAQKREKVAKDLKDQLNSVEKSIRREKETIEADSRRIEQIKQEKEQELEKQREFTKTLKDKLKILNLKIDAQDKREAPFRRFEKELKQRKLKLVDDRASLQRAISEKLRK